MKKNLHRIKSRKSSINTLERKADALLQKKLVLRHPDCLVCGDKTSEMHHVVYKSQSNALRYYMSNLVPLCRPCHYRHHFRGDASILATIIFKKGKEWWDVLQDKKREKCKLNRAYLEKIICELQGGI